MDYNFHDPEAEDADVVSYAAGHKAMGLYAMWALRNEMVRIGRLVLARDNGLAHPRLGLAISKKVLRRAVDRNLLKRVIRESFRHHQQELVGLDVVVLARSHCRSASRRQLRGSLARHWQRLTA